jgi:hypothetical protein
VSAVEELIEFYRASEGLVSTEGRDQLQDVLEEHAGETVATGGAGAPSYFGCRETEDGIEWCHWIKYSDADRVCIRSSNRYVSGFSVHPNTTRLVDARFAPATFQLYLQGFDVDGEPIGADRTTLDTFTGSDER